MFFFRLDKRQTPENMFYGSKGYCRSDTHGHQAGKAIYQTLTASARNTFMAILVSRYATWVKNLPRKVIA